MFALPLPFACCPWTYRRCIHACIICRVGQNHTYIRIYSAYGYYTFSWGFTIRTVIYGVCTRLWPILGICRFVHRTGQFFLPILLLLDPAPGHCQLSIGLARTIYIRCIYGIFGREFTKYTIIYVAYIRCWPTPLSDMAACAV